MPLPLDLLSLIGPEMVRDRSAIARGVSQHARAPLGGEFYFFVRIHLVVVVAVGAEEVVLQQ